MKKISTSDPLYCIARLRGENKRETRSSEYAIFRLWFDASKYGTQRTPLVDCAVDMCKNALGLVCSYGSYYGTYSVNSAVSYCWDPDVCFATPYSGHDYHFLSAHSQV